MRWLVAQLTPQRFARRVELASLAADTARPGVAPECIDHGAADTPFGKRLELDASVFVEPVSGIDEADDSVLDKITDVDRIWHGRRHAACEGFDKRDPRDDSAVVMGGNWMGAHSSLLGDSALVIGDLNESRIPHRESRDSDAHLRNGDTNGRACVPRRDVTIQEPRLSCFFELVSAMCRFGTSHAL
jgi:hypothetical protein